MAQLRELVVSGVSRLIGKLYATDINASGTISGDLVGKVNNHTINADVPSGAVFTDTQSDWDATSGSAQILNRPTLATVATTGNYDDLSGKPTIPSAITETTVNGWGFTKNVGTVTSVNNVQPTNGNVTITIPSGTAASKDVDTSISTGSTSANLPTSAAVALFVDGQGYKTEDEIRGIVQDELSELGNMEDQYWESGGGAS